MSDFQALAEQFVAFYYHTFDQDRKGLAALYRDGSMMTWEQEPVLGTENIVHKLVNLPFGKVVHRKDTVDAQPAGPGGGIMVLVTGALQAEGQDRPMSFTQTFHLLAEGSGYYVCNDMFRIVYPAA